MFFKKSLPFCLAALLAPISALADETPCTPVGSGADFCHGSLFQQLHLMDVDGVSFWLHEDGFVSKVLVETTGGKSVSRATLEQKILSMVNAQAKTLGRVFDFSDLAATTLHGVPFGTFSYALRGEEGTSPVLHSFIATKGRVLQVVSQRAVPSDRAGAADLEEAHGKALQSVQIGEPMSDA